MLVVDKLACFVFPVSRGNRSSTSCQFIRSIKRKIHAWDMRHSSLLFVRKMASYFAKPVFEADRDEDVPLHKLLQRRSSPGSDADRRGNRCRWSLHCFPISPSVFDQANSGPRCDRLPRAIQRCAQSFSVVAFEDSHPGRRRFRR
jgi:hypothetical protein